MPAVTFEDNAEKSLGIDARSDAGYRTLAYDGDLGGGTLAVFTAIDGVKTPVSGAVLSAATVDEDEAVIVQLNFQSSGTVWVHLTGATDPDVTVAVA